MEKLTGNYDDFEGLNQSFALKLLNNTKGIKYPKKKKDDDEDEGYDAFFIGKAFHFYVLQCVYDSEFLNVYEPTDMRFGTNKFEEFKDACKFMGKDVIKQKDWDSFKIMKYEMNLNKYFKTIMENISETEVELKRYLLEHDIWIKGRLDILTNTSHRCCDVKTIKPNVLGNATKLRYHIIEYGYHLQALFYNYLLGIDDVKDMKYLLFFVEKEAPYNMQTVQLSVELLYDAEYLFKEAVKRYKQYKKHGIELTEGYDLPSLII